ncbi:MAG: zinc ribbon domain-containing protein [Planctomycetaceae bacterium]|nr:zinc ribbon domain-containing protein [Planctomycetaceae bacterium]
MPTYDYRCKACDHTWEEFKSIMAPPTKKCPECGKKKAERQIGPGAGLIFRGSGFYITDYRSEGYKKSADADSKAQSGGESKGDSKGDSKSTTKSEPAKSESKGESKSSSGDSGKSAKS